jgi:hypothetical protein
MFFLKSGTKIEHIKFRRFEKNSGKVTGPKLPQDMRTAYFGRPKRNIQRTNIPDGRSPGKKHTGKRKWQTTEIKTR